MFYYFGIIPLMWWLYFIVRYDKLREISVLYKDKPAETTKSALPDLLIMTVLYCLSSLWFVCGLFTFQWIFFLLPLPVYIGETIYNRKRVNKGLEPNRTYALISACVKVCYTNFLIQNGLHHYIELF